MGVPGNGTLPSREGLGMGGVHSSRSSEPVTRPTALKIPPPVPLTLDGGAAGGSAVGRLAHWLPQCVQVGAATQRRPHCSPAAAALRPTCHRAQRMARRSSRSGHKSEPAFAFRAARLRAWRVVGGTIWPAQHRAEHSAANCKPVSSSSGTVGRAQRDGHWGPRPRPRERPPSLARRLRWPISPHSRDQCLERFTSRAKGSFQRRFGTHADGQVQ